MKELLIFGLLEFHMLLRITVSSLNAYFTIYDAKLIIDCVVLSSIIGCPGLAILQIVSAITYIANEPSSVRNLPSSISQVLVERRLIILVILF